MIKGSICTNQYQHYRWTPTKTFNLVSGAPYSSSVVGIGLFAEGLIPFPLANTLGRLARRRDVTGEAFDEEAAPTQLANTTSGAGATTAVPDRRLVALGPGRDGINSSAPALGLR